jgi:hypothetical protein
MFWFETQFHYGSMSAFEVTYCWVATLFIFYFVQKQSEQSEADYSYLEKKLGDAQGISKLHGVSGFFCFTLYLFSIVFFSKKFIY